MNCILCTSKVFCRRRSFALSPASHGFRRICMRYIGIRRTNCICVDGCRLPCVRCLMHTSIHGRRQKVYIIIAYYMRVFCVEQDRKLLLTTALANGNHCTLFPSTLWSRQPRAHSATQVNVCGGATLSLAHRSVCGDLRSHTTASTTLSPLSQRLT